MIVLLASGALALAIGTRLSCLGVPDGSSRATASVRAALWTCASLVLIQELLGTLGCLGPRATLAALAAVATAVFAATRRLGDASVGPREPWTALEVGLATALAAALTSRLWHGWHRETCLYDTLSYHLHAPQKWMHDGRLSIVAAVFGDPAPAYAPSNVELGFLFLMAPLRSDAFAAVGQLPLAVLSCLGIAAAVREGGGPRGAALAGALAFLMIPEPFTQTATAMVDLGTAAFFLSALPFLVRLGRAARPADACAFGLALGLLAGTKVVGLVFAALLALAGAIAFARAGRAGARAAALALIAAIVTGGYWYARNLAVTGNPLYPVAVKVGTTTIFPGLLDTALLRTSEYHVPPGDLRTLGRLLLEPGLLFLLMGTFGLVAARRALWPLLAAGVLGCFWLVSPYQETRFLFPLWGILAIALGVPRADAHPTAWVPLAVATLGSVIDFPTAERWSILGVGALAALATTPLRPRLGRRAFLAGATVLATAALVAGAHGYEGRAPAYSVGDELDGAWAWFRANVRGARVAYTGNNLPFPLAGAGLSNDVRYVNVAGAPSDLTHDFARRTSQPATTPEPAPYREGARYESWRANLRATRREVLFVAALYPAVRHTIVADAQGFPVERAWADAHPEAFTLRFASPAARVYAVAP